MNLQEFASQSSEKDPLKVLQNFQDHTEVELLKSGEYDPEVVNEVRSQLFAHAQESGIDMGDKPEETFLSRGNDSDLELVARHSQDEGVRASARTLRALQDEDLKAMYADDPQTYQEKLDAAKLDADSLLTPTVRDAARKAALQSGELPFAVFRNSDGTERLDISPQMKEFAGNDQGLASLFEANPQLDRSRIGEIRAKLQTPEGYTAANFEIDRQSEFIQALGTIASSDADVAGKLASLRAAVDTGSEGNLQPFIDQIDTQLANHGLHADGSTAQERQTFIKDYLMANAAPAADFENVDANVRTLSTGQAVIPMAVLMNKPLFEKTMAESTRIPAAQKEQMAAMRESQISAAAPESFKIIAANRSDFTPFFDQKKAAGASNAEILDEWMANSENYSSFRSYAGGVGESVIEGFGGLLLYPAAMMGSESARKGLASLQQSDAERRAYASLFGKNLGVGYDVARLVAPVAADVGVSILTGGAATSFVGAKTGFRSALRATLAASLSAETKSLARSFTVRAAGGAAKTAGMSADQVLTAAGRDMAQKFTTSATTASFLATAFNRSAGATYVQLFSTLEGQKNPDGTPKYTPEKVREIALHHGLVAGAITASVTGAFSFLGRGGLESIYSGMSRKQLDGVFNRLKTDWGKMAPSVREGVNMASAEKMLESVIRKSITPFFKTLGQGTLDEAAEEGIDQTLGYVNQQMATGEKFNIDDAVRQGAYAALLGGIMGGGVVGIREVGSSADVSASSEALARRDALLSTARKLDATSPRTAAAVRELAMRGISSAPEKAVPETAAPGGSEPAPGAPELAGTGENVAAASVVSSRLKAAALRDPTSGKVFTGVTHGDANPRDKTQLDIGKVKDPTEHIGFVDESGQWVSSDEALRKYGVDGSEQTAAYLEDPETQQEMKDNFGWTDAKIQDEIRKRRQWEDLGIPHTQEGDMWNEDMSIAEAPTVAPAANSQSTPESTLQQRRNARMAELGKFRSKLPGQMWKVGTPRAVKEEYENETSTAQSELPVSEVPDAQAAEVPGDNINPAETDGEIATAAASDEAVGSISLTPLEKNIEKITKLKGVISHGDGVYEIPRKLWTPARAASIRNEQEAARQSSPRGTANFEIKDWSDVTGRPEEGSRSVAILDRRARIASRTATVAPTPAPAPTTPAVGTTVTFTTKVPGAPSQGTVVSIDAKTGKAVIAAEGTNWTGATITGAVEAPDAFGVTPTWDAAATLAGTEYDNLFKTELAKANAGDEEAANIVWKMRNDPAHSRAAYQRRRADESTAPESGLTELPNIKEALTETTPEAEAIADALAAPDPAAAIEEAGMEQELAAAAEAAVPGLVTGWTETQRNANKPEQMTPEERVSQLESGTKGRTSLNWQGGHAFLIKESLSKQQPVSAEAVDTYGIKLPDGYTKQGELYVYQTPRLTPDEILAIAEPAIAADPLVSAATVNGTPGDGVTGSKVIAEPTKPAAPKKGKPVISESRAIKQYPKLETFFEKDGKRWLLRESRSGAVIGRGATKQEAIGEAERTLIWQQGWNEDYQSVYEMVDSFIEANKVAAEPYGISEKYKPTREELLELFKRRKAEKEIEIENDIESARRVGAMPGDGVKWARQMVAELEVRIAKLEAEGTPPPTDPVPRLQQSLDAVRAKVGAPKQVFSEANSPVSKDLNAHGFDAGITPFLQSVAATGKPEHRALAKLLLRFPEMLAAVDVVKTHAPDAAFAGVFVPKTGQVLVNTAVQGPRGGVDTVLHEMLHAATAHSIDHPTPAQAAVIKRIESIRRNVLKRAQKSGDRSLIYGLSDTHEFLTHFLTDPAFQRQIGAMTPKGERNWVEVIVQAIRDLINGRARTQAEQVSQQIFSDLIAFTQDAAAMTYGRHARTTDGKVLMLPAHHGTPHKVVGGFSTDKIGTGEGAQAYGYGLYFAGNESIARYYRDTLSSRVAERVDLRVGGQMWSTEDVINDFTFEEDKILRDVAKWMIDEVTHGRPADLEMAIKAIRDGSRLDKNTTKTARIDALVAKGVAVSTLPSKGGGNLYTVEILADEDEMLDWDKPLSEQSEKVRSVLESAMKDKYSWWENVDTIRADGAYLYNQMGGGEIGSKVMNSLGIKGIRYLDGNSRSGGEGSYNYVIFDGKDIQITHENGKPVTPEQATAPEPGPYGQSTSERLMLLPEGPVRDNARFRQLTADIDPTPEGIEAFKTERPGAYAELKAMREEALNAAMPDSVVRPNAAPNSWDPYQHDPSKPLIKLFHGGEKGITSFSKIFDRPQSGYKQGNVNSQGVWLTQSRGVEGEIAEFFGSSDAASYAQNYDGGGQIYEVYANITNPKRMAHRDTQFTTAKELLEQGYDGVYTIDSGFWVALKPEQIKSAEPLNLSDDGKLIQPSAWGDAGSDDIRFLPEGETDSEFNQEIQKYVTGKWPSDPAGRYAELQRFTETFLRPAARLFSIENEWTDAHEMPPGINRTSRGAGAVSRRRGVDEIVIFVGKGNLLSTAETGGLSEFEAKRNIAIMLHEEIDHAAYLEVAKRNAGPGGDIDTYVTRELRSMISEIQQNSTEPVNRALYASMAVYDPRVPQINPTPDIAGALANMDLQEQHNMMQEFMRQVLQLRRQGVITESLLQKTSRVVSKWFNARVRDIRSVMNNLGIISPTLDRTVREMEGILNEIEVGGANLQPEAPDLSTPDTIRDTVAGFTPDGVTLDLDYQQLTEDVRGLTPVNAEHLIHSMVNRELAHQAGLAALGDTDDAQRYADFLARSVTGNTTASDIMFYRGNPNAMERLVRYLTGALKAMAARLALRFDLRTSVYVDRLSRELAKARDGYRVRSGVKPFDPDDVDQPRFMPGAMDWQAAVAMMQAQGTGTKSWDKETMELFVEQQDAELGNIMGAWLSRKEGDKVPWRRVPAARLKRIWNDYGKAGVVRDEKGMDNIADMVMKNIARLHVANALSGHDQIAPMDLIEGQTDDFDEERDMEAFQDFLTTKDGEWYVSDYGLPHLYPIYKQIYKAETAEEKLHAVDRALNVVHQRGDLAAMFVEGGTKTLQEVFEQGTDEIRLLPGGGAPDSTTRYTKAHVGNKVLSARAGDELTPQGFTGWWRRMFGQKDDLHRMQSEDKVADEQLKRATQEDLKKLQKELHNALGDIDEATVIDRIGMALGDTSPLLTEEEENRIEAEMQERIKDAHAIAAPLIEDAKLVRKTANAAARKAYKTALRSEDLKVRDRALGILNDAKAANGMVYDETVSVAHDRTAKALDAAAEWERDEKIESEINRAAEMRRVRDLAQESLDTEHPALGKWTMKMRKKITDLQEQVRDIYGDKPDLQLKIDRSLGIYLVRSYRIHQDKSLAEKILHSPDYKESRDNLIGFFEEQLGNDEVARMKRGGKFEGLSDDELLALAPDERVAREMRKLKRRDAYKGVPDDDIERIARNTVAEQAQLMFEDFILGHEGGTLIGGSTTDIRTDFTRFMRKKNLPPEIRDALQENLDPMYNADRTFTALSNILHSQRLLTSLRDSGVASGIFIDEATRNGNTKYRHWKPVVAADAQSQAFAPLAGWYASPEDVESFQAAFHTNRRNAENTSEKASGVLNRFILGMAGSALGIVTLGNPGFYVRNPFGGIIALLAQGSNPFTRDTVEAVKVVKNAAFSQTSTKEGFDAEVLEAIAYGVVGNGAQIGYTREILNKYNENPLGFLDWVQQKLTDGNVSAGEALGKARDVAAAGAEILGNIAQLTEEFPMFVQWKKEIATLTRAKWGTETEIKQEAARRAKMVIFNKSESSQAIKTFSTNPVSALVAPFVRFKSELWRTFVNTYRLAWEDVHSGNPVLKENGIRRFAAAGAVHVGLTTMLPLLLAKLAGIGDDEDRAIRASMPEYAKNTSFFFWRMNGELYSGDLTYLNPFSFNMDPVTSAIRAVKSGDYGDLPSVLTRVITEEVFGENVVSGKLLDIKRNKDEGSGLPVYLDTDDWSARTSKMLAHVGSAYAPPLAKTLTKMYDSSQRPDNADQPWYYSTGGLFFSQFVPTKPRLINPEEAAYRAFRDLARANGQTWQITAPLKNPAGFNPNEVEDVYDDMTAANYKVQRDAYRLTQGFKKLGVKNNAVYRVMTDAGFSREKTGLILQGRGQRKVLDPASLKKMHESNPELVQRWLAKQREHAMFFDVTK